MHIVLLGLMGVGKSTTAQAFADAHGLPCHDSDVDMQTLFGFDGAAGAESFGVDELHRLESALLLARLVSDTQSVISAAASIVEDQHCRAALVRRAQVAVLQAPLDQVLRRAASGTHRRPMLRAELHELAERRAPLFAQVANLVLDATKPTKELVADMNGLLS